jgi:hypothetical protein
MPPQPHPLAPQPSGIPPALQPQGAFGRHDLVPVPFREAPSAYPPVAGPQMPHFGAPPSYTSSASAASHGSAPPASVVPPAQNTLRGPASVDVSSRVPELPPDAPQATVYNRWNPFSAPPPP